MMMTHDDMTSTPSSDVDRLSFCSIHFGFHYGIDRARRLTFLQSAAQVMKSKRVVGENGLH
jgi:hypothetical protein